MTDDDRGGREFPRVEASFNVTYATIDQLVVAYTKDLSRGGMFLCTTRFLPVNAVIRLEIDLPAEGGTVAVICRVAYARDEVTARTSGKPPGMGIEFLDLGGERLEQIELFIASQGGEPTEPKLRAAQTTRLDIVIADDEPMHRTRVSARFADDGHVVRAARDGLEALAMCLKNPPDVLLTDVTMPRMDGWQLLRMMRARPTLGAVVVIFLTTLEGEEQRLQGYKLGVDDFVPKSCTAEELAARVHRAVARAQQARLALAERKTLRGDLEQVSLASVLAFLELERKTGVLFVVSERTARLYLRNGQPVHVDIEGAGRDAPSTSLLFELLDWTAGQFEFALQDVPLEGDIKATTTALLVEHARGKDEATNVHAKRRPE